MAPPDTGRNYYVYFQPDQATITSGVQLAVDMLNFDPNDSNNATLFIASNSMPITEDRTDGFYRRWLIIDFPNKFEEGSDPLNRINDEEYNNLCLQLFELLPILISRRKGVSNIAPEIAKCIKLFLSVQKICKN